MDWTAGETRLEPSVMEHSNSVNQLCSFSTSLRLVEFHSLVGPISLAVTSTVTALGRSSHRA